MAAQEQINTLLRRLMVVPERMADLTRSMSNATLKQAPQPNEWSSYLQRRKDLTRMLAKASSAEWDHTEPHKKRGPVMILDQMNGLVDHEEEHLPQLKAAYKAIKGN